MRKVLITLTMFIVLLIPNIGTAAEVSADQMILEWKSSKVWMDNGDLCVTGTFVNRRTDLTITKLNDFSMKFIFIKEDGGKEVYQGKPIKLPFLKIPANGSKRITMNFGKYDGTWKSWVTNAEYVFTYVHGLRW